MSCAIYLPKKVVEESPYVILTTTESQANILASHWKFELVADVLGVDSEVVATIHAPEMYAENSRTRHWGGNLRETKFIMSPINLCITNYFQSGPASAIEEINNSEFIFWLTPSPFLNPRMVVERSFTGTVKYERYGNFRISLSEQFVAEFDHHFDQREDANGDLIQWSYLVAKVTASTAAPTVEYIEIVQSQLNDFLLFVSFAARHRTVVCGANAFGDGVFRKFYRGYIQVQEKASSLSYVHGVISPELFAEFAESAYRKFQELDNKEALRRALYLLLPFEPHTLETTIVRLFSGIEALALSYRRERGLEFTLPEEDWDIFQKQIKKSIKNIQAVSLSSVQRSSIYAKLEELNRISLRSVFEDQCQHYCLDVGDLWPVFSRDGQIGLSDLRSMLVHGEPLPPNLARALSYARDHLEFILERLILRALDWDIERSQVSQIYLKKNSYAVQRMFEANEEISKYVRSLRRR